MVERQLPNNIAIEKAFLGSITIDPDALLLVADLVKEEDLYRDCHRLIYNAMMTLYVKREPADFLTILDMLSNRGQLADIRGEGLEGEQYIMGLINDIPTSGNVEYYAKIIHDLAIRRRLIGAGSKIVTIAFEEEDAQVALEQAEQTIGSIEDVSQSGFVGSSNIINTLMENLEAVRSGEERYVGIPSGFSRLDFLTGGFQRTDLIIVAGRPAMGKSSLMASMLRHMALGEGKATALVTLEMSKEQVMERLVSMETGIPTQRIHTGMIHDHEWDVVMNAFGLYAGCDHLFIDDTGGLSIATLGTRIRRLHAEMARRGHPLSILFVDYVQLMKASSEYRGQRHLEIGEITMQLKNLAKELNIVVLALAQLSRSVETRALKIPQMSDLRESGNIENDADMILFIYRDEVYVTDSHRAGIADLIIAKHRNGPVGELPLVFQKEITLFRNPPRDLELLNLSEYYRGARDE